MKQSRVGEKILKSYANRLSVAGSVAPPGTAWGAEGLRGNEANENILIVLAPPNLRKGQKRMVLHKGHNRQAAKIAESNYTE
jgi:hypothetical protein